MKAQILITLDDDGRMAVSASVKNLFVCLGLLEAAKDVLKQAGQQQESQIEVPKLVIPR